MQRQLALIISAIFGICALCADANADTKMNILSKPKVSKFQPSVQFRIAEKKAEFPDSTRPVLYHHAPLVHVREYTIDYHNSNGDLLSSIPRTRSEFDNLMCTFEGKCSQDTSRIVTNLCGLETESATVRVFMTYEHLAQRSLGVGVDDKKVAS